MKPDIVYEDKHIIICNKPAGVSSQSDKSFDVDLTSQVLTYRTSKKEPAQAHIINRLDKPVGGLVLFAKDKETAAKLSALSGEHSIEKSYYALVSGDVKEKDILTDYLLKDAKNNISKVVSENTSGAKKASLIYEKIGSKTIAGKQYSLVKIRLFTGRHHQIRVQFASRNHPLYGDVKYNPEFAAKRGVRVTPALFAYRLSFENPYGAERITVEVDLDKIKTFPTE